MELWKDPDVPRVLPAVHPLPNLADGRFVPSTRQLTWNTGVGKFDSYVPWGPHKWTLVSAYGCGEPSCAECYPWYYSCDNCRREFTILVPNGETYTCEHCGYSTEGTVDHV